MEDLKRFLNSEARLIEISKWLAGEKMGRDPGDEYIKNWIEKYGEEFRKDWNKSKCSSCKKDCFYNLKAFCEEYTPA